MTKKKSTVLEHWDPKLGPNTVPKRAKPKYKQQWCYRCDEAHDKHE